MTGETAPAAFMPVEVRPASGRMLTRVAFGLAAVGTLVGVALILLIAGALSGIWRVLALMLLSPVLVVSILALFRAARAVAELTERRSRIVAELHKRGVVGIYVAPSLGAWDERVERGVLLAAGPHLLAVGPDNADSQEGQRRLQMLHSLLGQARPAGATLPLPARATLVMLEDDGSVQLWDVSAFFEGVDAEDESALDAMLDLEAHILQRVADAARAWPRYEPPR